MRKVKPVLFSDGDGGVCCPADEESEVEGVAGLWWPMWSAALEGHSEDPGVPLGVLGFQNQEVPAPGSDLDPADRGREFVPRRSLGEYIPFGERRGISLTVRAEGALEGEPRLLNCVRSTL